MKGHGIARKYVSGVTVLFNIVDNCEQCGQQNIVQSCFHQLLKQPDRF